MKIKTLTVTELNKYIKKNLDNDFILNNLSVKGEISNLKYHSSGHIYFSIKDVGGRINCVLFKMNAFNVKFKLVEGMMVVVQGRASIYPQTGSLQIYCEDIEKEGVGDLFAKFEKLKDKLGSLGYFDNENKKDLPPYPERIGIITSPTGAAVQDIINVARRRSSLVDLVVYGARVQGEGAEKELIEGIKYFNKVKSVDLIIIGRGGGSLEDLWNFNEESLAKEIFKSKLPIISAVGHEVDFTISDFVADLRAATPSQAAEIAIPEEREIKSELVSIKAMMGKIIKGSFIIEREKLASYKKILQLKSPKNTLENERITLDRIKEKLDSTMGNKISLEKQKILGFNNLLMAQNPYNILKKGYAIIEVDSKVVKTKDMLRENVKMEITLGDGKCSGSFSPDK